MDALTRPFETSIADATAYLQSQGLQCELTAHTWAREWRNLSGSVTACIAVDADVQLAATLMHSGSALYQVNLALIPVADTQPVDRPITLAEAQRLVGLAAGLPIRGLNGSALTGAAPRLHAGQEVVLLDNAAVVVTGIHGRSDVFLWGTDEWGTAHQIGVMVTPGVDF